MTIRLYLDEDSMRNALVIALQARGVDVLSALDAGMIERSDEVKDRVGLPGKALLSALLSAIFLIDQR